MRQRRLKFLLVTLLVASGLLFAGGEARANFTNFNYTVAFTADTAGTDNTRKYNYSFTGGGSSTTIKNILFEIPKGILWPNGYPGTYLPTGSLAVSYNGIPLTYQALEPGKGDTDTRLGVNDDRFSVLRINPPSNSGFPKNFTLVIDLKNLTLPQNTKLVDMTQVIQLKAGNSLSDSDTALAPSLESTPYIAPTLTGPGFTPSPPGIIQYPNCATLTWTSNGASSACVTLQGSPSNCSFADPNNGSYEFCPQTNADNQYLFTLTLNGAGNTQTTAYSSVTVSHLPDPPTSASLKADNNSLLNGDCTTLRWDSSGAATAVLTATDPEESRGSVAVRGSTRICPKATTKYTLTASNENGSRIADETVTVNEPPPPDITISQTTVEKPATHMNITFYSKGGIPMCTCETAAEAAILPYPCDNDFYFPTPCTKSSNVMDAPLLMCIPQIAGNEPLSCASDGSDGPNCIMVQNFIALPGSSTRVEAKCDVVMFNTADTILVIGQHSCEIGTYACTLGGRASTCYGYHCH